jgi:glucose/mannose-6-phosphate isomerase
MAPVARRWKSQINELAKAVASYEVLPEADNNALGGIYFPQEALDKEIAVFLQSSLEHASNQLRVTETRQIMMCEGINTDLVHIKGRTRLDQIWYGILLGDFVACYLAMCYEVDPTPIPSILALKEAMNRQ